MKDTSYTIGYRNPVSTGVDGFIAKRGMNQRKAGNNNPGGENVEQSATVVINNVIFDVTRVFAGKRKPKELLKNQVLAEAAASLTSRANPGYNSASGLAAAKEVIL